MSNVADVLPTVVFDRGRTPVNGGRIHLPVSTEAVPSKNTTLVTTLCGMVGTGKVKLRRGANCGECLAIHSQQGVD